MAAIPVDLYNQLEHLLGKDSAVFTMLNRLYGLTLGTAAASSVLTLDANKDFSGVRNASLDGTLDVTGIATFVAALKTAAGVGAKNGATVSVVEYGDGAIHKTVLTCTAMPITMGDEAGVGQWGGTKVYDFPAGLIMTLGAVIDGEVTTPVHDHASGGTEATWDGDVALGTAAPTDHATGLVVADTGRYLQSTATTIAIAQVGNCDAISIATGLTDTASRVTDGTGTDLDLFFNLLIDDDATNDAHEALFTGTITITWINLGDK